MTYGLPLVLPSLLYTANGLCSPTYSSLQQSLYSLVCTTYLAYLYYSLFYLPIAVYLVWSVHEYPVCYAYVDFLASYSLLYARIATLDQYSLTKRTARKGGYYKTHKYLPVKYV